jgi:hypothetical protein
MVIPFLFLFVRCCGIVLLFYWFFHPSISFSFLIWLVFVLVFFYRHFNCLVFFSLLMAYQVWLLLLVLELAKFQFWVCLASVLSRCCYDKFWKFLIALWYLSAAHVDWCFAAGVRGGHFYIVSVGISFYIRIVVFCFDCMWFFTFKVIYRWCFCFYYCFSALLLRGILFDFSYTCMAPCLIFPFFFFCLSASSILLSFVTIYCFRCALSTKKLQCGRVVMFLAF